MKLSKVLSLIVAICMLFTMVSFAAITFPDVAADASYNESVQVLAALKILNGYEDGSFKPEGKITRAEFSKVIACALGMGESAKGQTGTAFSDVKADHWASGFIAAAYNAGIINGMGDGTFEPESEVTFEQVIKMLVASIGFTPKAESLGGYPTGYMMVANQKNITVGAPAAQAGGAARSTVARVLYNTLTVNKMDQASFGGKDGPTYEEDKGQSILYSNLSVIKATAVVKDISLNKDERKINVNCERIDPVGLYNGYQGSLDKARNDVTVINMGNASILKGDVDVSGLQGLSVTALIDISNDDLELLAVISKSGKNDYIDVDPQLVSVVPATTGLSSGSVNVKYYQNISDDNEKTLKLAYDYTVYVNLNKGSQSDLKVFAGTSSTVTACKFVDAVGGDGIYDTVYLTNEKSFVIGSVNTTSYRIFRDTAASNTTQTFSGASVTLDPEDDNITWSLKDAEGKDLTLADLKAGQVANIKESVDGSNTHYDIVVTDNKITGVVSEKYEDNNKISASKVIKYTIDGKSYELISGLNDITPGSEITATVANNGKIIAYEVSATTRSYGVITGVNAASEFGTTYQVQLAKTDGSIATYNLYEKFNGQSAKYTPVGSSTPPTPVVAGSLEDHFQVGTLVCYELNSKGEIKNIATVTAPTTSGGINFAITLIDSTSLKTAAFSAKEYKESSEKIDSYYITDKTALFMAETGKTGVTKDKVMLGSLSSLNDGDPCTGEVIYDSASKEALAIVLYNALGKAKWDQPAFAITKKSNVTVDGDSRVKFTGYVNGEIQEFVVAEDKSAIEKLEVNDIILYALNSNNEIIAAELLAAKSGNKYVVATNWEAVTDEDNDNAVTPMPTSVFYGLTTDTSLYSAYYNAMGAETSKWNATTVKDAADAITDGAIATATNVTRSSVAVMSTNINGYAYAGKAYQLKGGVLRLVPGLSFKDVKNKYPTAKDGAVGERLYGPDADHAEALIKDFSVTSSAVAYIYNAKNNTLKATTVADLETDRASNDFSVSGNDNDDTVYVYNYDGITKLVLIVDAYGDSVVR